MKAAFGTTVNLVTQVMKVMNFSCWSRKSRTGTEALEKTSLVRESSCIYSDTPPYGHFGSIRSPSYYSQIFLAHW